MRTDIAGLPEGRPGDGPRVTGRRRRGLVRMPGLQQQRELRCWTVAELARRSGLKWPTAAAADAGDEVSAETAQKILNALEASLPSAIAMSVFGVGGATEDVGPGAAQGRGQNR